MPIKFRCVHCDQKLGIAHRKAGTQVQCPTCLRMVTVPVPDAEPVSGIHPAPAAQVRAAESPLFERSDFDDILKPKVPAPDRPAPARAAAPIPMSPPAKVWSVPLPAAYDVEPIAANGSSYPAIAPVGILLTPARATFLTALVVLLLGAAFAAGLVVGRWLL